MKKLVSSSEAAQLLGLSLQGIHYRIKKGQLESIKRDGKIFVYVDTTQTNTKQISSPLTSQTNDYKYLEEKIISSKDEQIHLLKKTIKFMKKQYTSEIHRLDKNQTQVLKVFQSEVDLLKSAFNEMRNIYKLDHQETTQINKSNESVSDTSVGMEFMDIKEFFVFMKNHNKSDAQIKSIILDKVKQSDKRFIYNKKSKEILIYKSDFLDLI
ncbi:DNA-binding protein [Arcobacteraceae bacterium]|nr:DNA-binding protein [Arcobacteraceae bacterium]